MNEREDLDKLTAGLAKLSAEDVAELYPADEDDGDIYGCDMRSGGAYDFFCTRPNHHAGPHVAWGGRPHAIWYSGKPVKLLFDE